MGNGMEFKAPLESAEETQNLPVEHPNAANLEKAYEKTEVEINENITERPCKRNRDSTDHSDHTPKKLAV